MRTNIEHIINLRKKNQLKYWVTFLRLLKKLRGQGYFSKRKAHKICELKSSTFHNHLNKMIKFGWIRKGRKGYFLNSYHRLFGLVNLKIHGDSEKELLARASALAFDRNVIAQIYRISGTNTAERKHRLALNKRSGAASSKYSASVRWFQNLFGYKSTRSGSKLEGLMEQFKLMKIVRNNVPLCPVGQDVKFPEEMNGRLFIKDRYFWERKLNTLIPMK